MNATPCLTCLTRLLAAATLASAAAGMALADPGALDGKRFEGVFIEQRCGTCSTGRA